MYSWAEEDEEDEEEVLEDKFGGKNLTIFLVDGTKGMSEQV